MLTHFAGQGKRKAGSRGDALLPSPHSPRNGEGHLQGLLVIQPRINLAGIGPTEIGFAQAPGTADALGNIRAGHFDMNPSQNRPQFLMDVHRPVKFVENIIETAGFDP